MANIREKIIFAIGNRYSPGFSRQVTAQEPLGTAPASPIDKIIKIYTHAFANFPFYKEKYEKAGLKPDSFKHISDTVKIPCLTKEELSQGFAKGDWKTVTLQSGGTAGVKAETLLDRNYLLLRYRKLLSILYSLGWQMGKPISALHPVEYGFFQNLKTNLKEKKFRKLVFEFIQQYILYRLFHKRKNIYYSGDIFEKDQSGEYLKNILRKNLSLLLTRPDVILALTRQNQSTTSFKKVSPSPLPSPLKGEETGGENAFKIITVGNILTESSRKRVADFFNSKVYNMYASTEAGYVGVSCDISGEYVHIDSENYLVEVDSANENEILITDFNNFGMPLIRYETRDVGEFAPKNCTCGRKGRLLRIIGRKGKYLVNDIGRKIYEKEIIDFIEKQEPELWLCQIARDGDSGIRMLIRPKNMEKQSAEKVLDSFCKYFKINPKRARLDFDSPLVKTTSGKMSYII